LAQILIALFAFSSVLMFALTSTLADSLETGDNQAASGNQETESTQTNNGSDITRPQTAFELRASDQGKFQRDE